MAPLWGFLVAGSRVRLEMIGKAGKEETWGCSSPFKNLSWFQILIRPSYVEYILDSLFLYFKCLSQGKNASSELLSWVWGGILDTGGCTAVNFGDPLGASKQKVAGRAYLASRKCLSCTVIDL